METLAQFRAEILSLKDTEKGKFLSGFFKTGKGEYAEGDIFYGIKVPQTRKIAKKYFELEIKEVEELLHSPIHEERLCALIILLERYGVKRTSGEEKKEIYELYLKNTKFINNWDLVDLSAPKIVGKHLWEYPAEKKTLSKLAKSSHLWEKRIAIVSTYYFITRGEFEETIKIAEILLNDTHDLIHKAAGWMLREVGKRDLEAEEGFLKKHSKKMPRTMLRYAIERFPEKKRLAYLKGSD